MKFPCDDCTKLTANIGLCDECESKKKKEKE